MNKITFSNKTHGKLDFTMADLIAWKAYMSDDKQPPHEDKIINLHPQPACSVKDRQPYEVEPEVLKKGRGRPKKIIQVVPVPEIIPELIIHQHPAPKPEPEPQLKRKVGRPRKIIQHIIQQYA